MRIPDPRARLARGSVALAGTVLLLAAVTACSGSDPGPGTEVVTGTDVVKTYEDFDYYNPCANEPLTIDGTTYYPLLEDEIAALDRDRYASASPEGALTGMVRIAPPGPGDDIGTMTVYADGVARFETDSGEEWWFNDEEHTYNWVC